VRQRLLARHRYSEARTKSPSAQLDAGRPLQRTVGGGARRYARPAERCVAEDHARRPPESARDNRHVLSPPNALEFSWGASFHYPTKLLLGPRQLQLFVRPRLRFPLLPQLVRVAQEHQASKGECQIRDEPQADGVEIAAKQEGDFRREQEGCTAKADDAK